MLIVTIAIATFREAVRARVFLYLLVVAAFVVVGAIPTADLGTGQELRLVTDLSMGGVSFTAAVDNARAGLTIKAVTAGITDVVHFSAPFRCTQSQ